MIVDSRRYSDGVRLHPLLGGILALGAGMLRTKFPGKRVTNAVFAAAAIRQFAKLGLIYKVEASKSVPTSLPGHLVAIAKRQSGSPIWFPTDELAEKWVTIWEEVTPGLQGDILHWTVQSKSK